jgi:hypothetical protein
MFESYRGRLLSEIADKLREARDESREPYLGDMLDLGERFHEEDLQYTLLGMKTETIQRIDEALDRLAEGEYGSAVQASLDVVPLVLGHRNQVPHAKKNSLCKPSKVRNRVSNWLSSHNPANPGRIISRATVVIFETQFIASAIPEQSGANARSS